MAEEDLENNKLTNEDDESSFEQLSLLERLKQSLQRVPILNRFATSRNLIILSSALFFIVLIFIFNPFKSDTAKIDSQTTRTNVNQGRTYTAPNLELSKTKKEKKSKKRIKYKLLFKGLSNEQIIPTVRELSINDIQFEVEQSGSKYDLSIDQDQYDEAKNLLAIKGLPSSSKKGFAIFDEASNLGATEFDKRIRLMRALSGEMEIAISQFEAIDEAQVKLVMPEQRLFDTEVIPVTASILIRPSREYKLTDSIVYAIIQLVTNGIESLDQENVSVVDTYGRVLSEGIFERLNRTNLKKSVEEKEQLAIVQSNSQNTNIQPENLVNDLNKWIDLKNKYESLLVKQATESLTLVLPDNSYKIAATASFKDVNAEIPSYEKFVIKIDVNPNFPGLNFTPELKQTIFSSIANSVPYVKGRDSIQLALNVFEVPQLEDSQDLQDSINEITDTDEQESSEVDQLLNNKKTASTSLLSYWPVLLVGLTVTILGYLIFFYIRRQFKSSDDDFLAEAFDQSNQTDPIYLDKSNLNTPNTINFEQLIEHNTGIPKALWTSKTLVLIDEMNTLVNDSPQDLAQLIENELVNNEVVNG